MKTRKSKRQNMKGSLLTKSYNKLSFVLEQKLNNLTHVKEDLEINLNVYIIFSYERRRAREVYYSQ